MAKRPHSAHEAQSLMNGRLDEVSLPELVQLLATGRRSVRVEITRADGRRGELVLEEGQVTECEFADLLGEEAFFALYQAGGRFAVYRFDPDRSRRAAISRGWQELVFEAARRFDEASSSTEDLEHGAENVVRLPVGAGFESLLDGLIPSLKVAEPPAVAVACSGPDASPTLREAPRKPSITAEIEGPPPADSFDDLFADALRAYMRRDLDAAQALFSRCHSLRPNDRRVAANLERLAHMRTRKGR